MNAAARPDVTPSAAGRGRSPALVAAILVCALAAAAATARAAEIVFADGTRETVQDPRQDGQGRWLATRDGHRTILRPGEVVVIVDDAGKETVTIPPLADTPDGPEVAATLASLRDPKNDAWHAAAERLGLHPTKSLHDALVAMTKDAKKDVRGRAIAALALLRTKESVVAAAEAVLAEKDAALRRDASSSLFAAWEVFRRAPVEDVVRRGLADKDAAVRVSFATLAPLDCADAVAVLKADGLRSADHHTRESAAVQLGLRGDGAGESVLVAMLARPKLPGVDDPALMERLMVREKVEICGILGKLATDAAKAALRKAAASGPEAVRKAAAAALAAAEAAK